ncbi:hypothetical protein HRR83_001728 [Exophiala dermatitidis]|uniref:Extracellular mutant protein 11 C-terminal domain-containing protein n=2 Tax=Exophiala dermatitidis TaxID=5970 RepID=H6C5L0_EXODN|nr:uncharacterized protein HMPREF1120_07006 [Exophiala dermatitidis NIH/UT8656]KAJ4516399.1 hypothetical protein HRR73_004862 [Exophiala dermatitidis]EHY59006.1 hypothetical protein HMPREF1120_07006 [Exophiala dermatitidis NIH/UT8656]KAJ4526534.1 hypothetical protein HRR74_001732 [Exophiala dermatitidis]KAJ4546255.1 hypothetical protein HRR77_004791 [Exophiala dermatitidis]KAJ4567500.1 hypothetical protein HRR79_005014 [Exophiala dermatitidis]
MPLQANMKQFIQNREGSNAQASLAKRSLTPQPKGHGERGGLGESRDEAGRKPRATSRDGKGLSKAKRQEAAMKLKLPIPNTINKRQSDHPYVSEQDVAEVASAIAQNRSSRTVPNMQAARQPGVVSAFDDTQSIHFDDSTSIAEDHQDASMIPHFHARNSPAPLRSSTMQQPPPRRHEEHPPPGPVILDEREAFPGDWRAEADAERQRHGEPPQYNTRYHNDTGHIVEEYMYQEEDEGYDPDGDYAEPSWENTPSRTRIVPAESRTIVSNLKKSNNVKSAAVRHALQEEPLSPPLPVKRNPLTEITSHNDSVEPHPLHHNNVNRFKIGGKIPSSEETGGAGGHMGNLPKEPLAPTTTSSLPVASTSNIPQPAFSSKVSSYHESSSSEEDQAAEEPPEPSVNTDNVAPLSSNAAAALKRPYPYQEHELDFSPEILSQKTIAELDAIPFTTDPSAPPPESALDANGNPMTLSAKLTNLNKMRPEAQRQLFRSQTDDEREQTAAWFLDKFQQDMQKLMAVRLERRKIALRFELEVKKRERRVQVKKNDVDRDLEGLRKGGVELISGRHTPAK